MTFVRYAGILTGLLLALAGPAGAHPLAKPRSTDTPTSATAPAGPERPRDEVLAAMKRAADWQLANPSKHRATDWTQGAWYAGLTALGEAAGEAKYREAMVRIGQANRWQLGPRAYHADDLCVGAAYAGLCLKCKDPAMIKALRERCDAILARPSSASLDFRKPGHQDRWSWCDALFMAPPAWTLLAKATGEKKYLEFMNREWWATTEFLYDKQEHLFFRDSTYFSRREANGRKVFWGRGNGWVLAGLARVLQHLPRDHADRARYETLFKEMAARILSLQQADGLWHASLLDPGAYPLPETSGSGFFCYALAWGVNAGLLDRAACEPAVRRAWAGLAACLEPDGRLTHVQPIGGDPRAFDPRATECYGVGAFLLAGSEVVRLGPVAASPAPTKPASAPKEGIMESLDVALVPSEFPVGFCLLTHGTRQYVAYYDAKRDLTVAARALDSGRWQHKTLPSRVGWDSHNYVTMALDDDGQIHLSGNMHAAPLVYFRTSRAGDIASFERIAAMTGENERRCTYPKFLRGADGRLIFHYRDGGSGNGNEIYNVYDPARRAWKRLLDKPLTDGRGKMNAYAAGPSRGPDGWFHLAWVWRDSPDCQTNHDPSCARSRDLLHWETIDGRPLALPITIDSKGTLIDRVPAKGGILNGALSIGFDGEKRPLASYYKFDAAGKTQAYVARFEGGRWVPRQVSRWDYRWEFKGGGSIGAEIRLGAVHPHGAGKLALSYSHVKHGSGLLIIDEKTLEPLGTEKQPSGHPASLSRPESDFPGMTVRWADDLGTSPDPACRYVLRWEVLPPNRDRPRTGPLPAPSMLRVIRLPAKE